MPIEGTFRLCLSLGFPCPQLLSTSSLTFRPSPHHRILEWLSHLPAWSLAMRHLPCIPTFSPSRVALSCSHPAACLSLPPWLWVSSPCRNPLALCVHGLNCGCSSRFSLNVTFFAKLPPALWAAASPSSLWGLRSPSEFLSPCAVLVSFASVCPPVELWEGWWWGRRILGCSFCILSRLHNT